jgi:capsular exopolysaccharide synthesis family protein
MDAPSKDLNYYLRLFLRKKWIIILSFLSVTGVGVSLISSIDSVYEATARLLIERENMKILDVRDVSPTNFSARDYFQTQVELLKSRDLVQEVIEKLDLKNHPEFNPNHSSPKAGSLQGVVFNFLKNLMSLSADVNPQDPPPPDISSDFENELFVDAYLARLYVQPVRNTRIVNISFMAFDPVLAAQVANTHAELFIKNAIERKASASKEAIRWLRERIKEAREKLNHSTQALQSFQKKENIVSLQAPTQGEGAGEGQILAQKFTQLTTELASAKTRRIELETLLHQLKNASRDPTVLESLPQIMNNPVIRDLKVQYFNAVRDLNEARLTYGEKHPRIIALKAEIKETRDRIYREIKKVTEGIKLEYRMTLARERNLQRHLEKAKEEALELNQKSLYLQMLQQEMALNNEVYQMLLRRLKEATLASGLKTINLFIVDRAKPPINPAKPDKRKMAIIAAFLGLMLGFGIPLFFDYMDKTFHGENEVAKYLGIPFLGLVSKMRVPPGEDKSSLVTVNSPDSHFSECLRNICTNIAFSLVDPAKNSVLVTSTNPAEGKSLIAANLAILISQYERKVLLIDADLRRPKIHDFFGIKFKEPGLSNLVTQVSEDRECIRNTHLEMLDVLPAGYLPPNPVALLSSERFRELIHRLKMQYEFIIIDSPPVLSATDASVTGVVADGVVLVIEASRTKRDHAARAVKQLRLVKAEILGAILNKVDLKKEGIYYDYYLSYYNYYSKKEKTKKRIMSLFT